MMVAWTPGLLVLALMLLRHRVGQDSADSHTLNVGSRPLADHRSAAHTWVAGGRLTHNHRSKAPMNQHWIETLSYSVENFSERGDLLEVLARLHDLDAARAAYEACRSKYPKRLLFLCQGGRTLRRSDREISEVRTL